VAAVDDLISRIEDKALRDRLKNEVDRLAKEKKFGLVFEDHLPELTPIYSAPIQRGSIVALRGQAITNTWRVTWVKGDKVRCMKQARGETQEFGVGDLVVVRQFGEPIFPSLLPLGRVENGGNDAPWHTLIETDNFHALQLLEYLYAGQVDCIYIDPPYNTGARDWKYNNDYVDENDRWRHSKWLAMMRRRLRLARRLLKPDTGVLIVTIDEHEVHHLGMLLEQEFPEAYRQMVTIVINQKGMAQ
jgi:adenine-specific DNA-methyltransferase